MKKTALLLLSIWATYLAIGGCATNRLETYDLVISRGRVIDPETGLDAIRNVGIEEGHIVAVTTNALQGRQRIDANGLVVSPGFIDLHAHAQNVAGQTYQVHDGVTMALELEGGIFPFPNQETEIQPLQKQLQDREGKSLIHYGYSAGYLGGRFLVKNRDWQRLKYEISSGEERKQIYSIIEQQLDKGAIGIGLPLDYISKGVDNAELEGIFRLAARRQVPLFVHIRMSDDVLDPSGFRELVDMVRKTSASLHMVHITSTGLGRTPLYIDMLEKAQAEGLDITTEVYPYTANQTGINAQILDNDWETRWGISYQDVEWPPTGERFTDKKMWDDYKTQYPNENVIMHSMKEEWVEMAIGHPGIMIISDGSIQQMDQRVHPRVAGTYARVLGRYVREKHIISLPEAIAKMTYLPAKRLQNFTPIMKHKGRLQVGADADITIFDPDTVIDRATFAEPNQFSEGIKYVIVDGQVVVKDEVIQPGIYPGSPIATGSIHASEKEPLPPMDRTAVEKAIDVDGYKLNFRYTPGKLPAIVFEAGGGMTSNEWADLQASLGKTIANATVSYDRAGFGESQLTDGPYDVVRETKRLHAGLEQLGLANQVLLVGHSYGGLLIQMYAHLYPRSVTGLLYLDVNTVAFMELEGGAENYVKPHQLRYPPDEEPENDYHRASKKQIAAFPKTIEQLKQVNNEGIPCFVISSDQRWRPTKQANDNYRKSHKMLADTCNTELIIAKDSNHIIPTSAPDVVIATLKKMLSSTAMSDK